MKKRPTKTDDRYEAARLLSGRDRLSVLEKEDILDGVLARGTLKVPSRATSFFKARRVVAALALGGATAVTLFLVTSGRYSVDELTSRGATLKSTPSFKVACAEGDCHQGDKLLFQLENAAPALYFAAYAQRDDGVVLWYFPGESHATSVPVSMTTAGGILAEAVVLGPEHRPGAYRVVGIFSPQALSKNAIKNALGAEPALYPQEWSVVSQILRVK